MIKRRTSEHKSFLMLGMGVMLFLTSCGPKGNHDGKVDTQDVNISQTADHVAPNGSEPVMKFETESHDFGKITEGEHVKYGFKFKNTGKSELIISDAQGSCGCTKPEYPNKPVAPGEEAVLWVGFNSEGKHGMQEKTVTIVANTIPRTKTITIKTQVLPPQGK
ncbi:MAG: DUF1573 domain-containing protein [Bacteroidia bacterium]